MQKRVKYYRHKEKENIEKAYFAGGCFWGVENQFQKINGVVSTKVGYMGGQTNNPSYEEVCGGKTGHAETVKVVFDSSKLTFEELVKVFFKIHDPSQVNRQGPDIGSQYRSAIFYISENQKLIAEKIIQGLKNKGLKIATQLVKADTFWDAEEYHQNYYQKNKLRK